MKHYILSFILATVMALASTACSDNDELANNQLPSEEEVEDVDYDRFIEVASRMFDFDSSDTLNYDFQPKYGEVLEPMKPTVYTMGLKSVQEAKTWFIEHCVPMDERDSIASLSDENLTISFGKYGSIRYAQSGNSSSYATIYLDLTLVNSQSSIEIIPLDLWPHNIKSLFYVGNIVKEKAT